VDRGVYALVGVIGFALKHNLDRLIATAGFDRRWTLFNYWEPLQHVGQITSLHQDEAKFLATLVATALPFIWVGVVMTLKRLRSTRAPLGLVILFFVPFFNLIFFLALSLLPAQVSSGNEAAGMSSESAHLRFIPDNVLASASWAVFLTAAVGLGTALLATQVLRNYGWGLFVALPFALGLISATIHGIRQPRGLGSCIGVASVSVIVLGATLLAVAVEGGICLIMAFPIALLLAIAGGVCGYFVQKRPEHGNSAPAYLAVLLVLTPSLQWVERALAPRPRVFVVRSSVDIKAPPEDVWKQVVAFSQIGPPHELLFRAGIAYPIRAEIVGRGAGAKRRCVFSTGAFVEPIQIWDEPRQLKFSVTENPPPLEEWTPYHHIEPPHLQGFLKSEGGQFLLTSLPNGSTRLEGTTWYQHGLWPAAYWRLWSDEIIHCIHMRVLMHIQEEVEGATSAH